MHLIFQQYLERLERREAKPNTLKNIARTAVLFEESGLDPLTATDVEIEEWLAGLRSPRTKGDAPEGSAPARMLSPRTIRLHAENMGAALGYAARRGIIQVNPMEMVRLPREPDKEPRILETHELRHILGNTMTDQQELMITTLIYTGMRRAEIRNLKWEDFSPTSIRVIGKGDKLRHVPLHPALGEMVMTQTPRSPYVFPGRKGPLSETSLFDILEKVRGNVLCTMHDFRRTVATQLAEHDVPMNVIDKIMGWAPRTVGSRYYIRTADLKMQEAILQLYSDDPITTTRKGAKEAVEA